MGRRPSNAISRNVYDYYNYYSSDDDTPLSLCSSALVSDALMLLLLLLLLTGVPGDRRQHLQLVLQDQLLLALVLAFSDCKCMQQKHGRPQDFFQGWAN